MDGAERRSAWRWQQQHFLLESNVDCSVTVAAGRTSLSRVVPSGGRRRRWKTDRDDTRRKPFSHREPKFRVQRIEVHRGFYAS